MAFLDRDAARYHGARAPPAGQPAAGTLDPQPLPLSRSAQPRAGGTVEGATRAECRRAGAARDSADDQRHLGGFTEQRVRGVACLTVIARSEATKQSMPPTCGAMDCFASLAMTCRTSELSHGF